MATDETTSKAVQVSSSPERPPTAAQQRATQHKGTADTEVLVNDIEKTREELASTIDEIVDRVSPKKVVERTKQQATDAAKQGVSEATAIAKEAAGIVRDKATTAGELLKEKTASVKDKVASGSTDSTPDRSPLAPATSVAVGSATPVASGPVEPADSAAASTYLPSPLPPGTQSIDTGPVPPPEPVDTTGSLADAAETSGPVVEPAGADVPSYTPVRSTTSTGPSSEIPVPAVAGAGVAAVVALLVLLLRRRGRRRRSR